MSLFSKKEAYLGIDLGSGGMKLVELHKTKGRAQLWTYGILDEELDLHVERRAGEPVGVSQAAGASGEKKGEAPAKPEDPRVLRYGGLLKELLASARVTTNRATASLPVSQIFHSVLTIPFIEAKKRDMMVKAEIEKLLPRPIEEMQVVHQEMPHEQGEENPSAGAQGKVKRYLRFLVTAAPKDLVSFYTAIFQKAGLQLEELETEAFALERSLVGRDPAVVMVVDIGSTRTNFFIMDSGLPATHRSIQIGGRDINLKLERLLGIPRENAEQAKRDFSRVNAKELPTAPFASVFDPIIKEIEYGFSVYMRQLGSENKRPEKIILTGGSAVFPPLVRRIEESFDARVFVGDPWARVVYQQGLKPTLDEIGPRMAVSIGLALRNIV
ncbi:MAG: hypothetical protein A3C90_03910 [Candidatus Magasanikbacteria bacterium RIFCSPHIGHO2_02_FULL_51_14]|uniref:SHS2 domain-containing protein n=1 Tax=Candidatus Magasanikbacteria bacterium RIFCSPHIGHO2_02_FULL_51_14 TaxID=1798683 RepID=A0A1F6MP17_9BACT|nr:MAG: hypothetical protein A3C90_03910 [Candidatus Magasanikbacteria bacterium RIFCSPHIGHO2_02_FULL_51_14]